MNNQGIRNRNPNNQNNVRYNQPIQQLNGQLQGHRIKRVTNAIAQKVMVCGEVCCATLGACTTGLLSAGLARGGAHLLLNFLTPKEKIDDLKDLIFTDAVFYATCCTVCSKWKEKRWDKMKNDWNSSGREFWNAIQGIPQEQPNQQRGRPVQNVMQ